MTTSTANVSRITARRTTAPRAGLRLVPPAPAGAPRHVLTIILDADTAALVKFAHAEAVRRGDVPAGQTLAEYAATALRERADLYVLETVLDVTSGG